MLTFATDGRQTLQGTLAANELDLTPYVSTIRLLTSQRARLEPGADRARRPDRSRSRPAAVGRAITIARAKLGRTAIAANLRGGKLTVTIGEAQAFGGIVKGSFALAASDNGADLKSQMQFTDVDLENCLGELFSFRRIEGRGNLTLAIEATGGSVLALTRTMNGTANLIGRQGALVGLNVEQLLRRLERRPLSGAGDFRNGRTPFEKLTVNLKIAQGIATVEDVRLEGPKVRLGLAGSASIPAPRFRPARRRRAGRGRRQRSAAGVRAAVRGAGPVGRSDHAAGHPEPAHALAGGLAAARRGQGPRRPRRPSAPRSSG